MQVVARLKFNDQKRFFVSSFWPIRALYFLNIPGLGRLKNEPSKCAKGCEHIKNGAFSAEYYRLSSPHLASCQRRKYCRSLAWGEWQSIQSLPDIAELECPPDGSGCSWHSRHILSSRKPALSCRWWHDSHSLSMKGGC